MFFKKKNRTVEWYPPVQDFMLVKRVEVYNLFTNKYTVREYDAKKADYYTKEFYRLLNQIDKNYDKLHQEFINVHKEFTTFEFWEKYLELEKVPERQLQEVH